MNENENENDSQKDSLILSFLDIFGLLTEN